MLTWIIADSRTVATRSLRGFMAVTTSSDWNPYCAMDRTVRVLSKTGSYAQEADTDIGGTKAEEPDMSSVKWHITSRRE